MNFTLIPCNFRLSADAKHNNTFIQNQTYPCFLGAVAAMAITAPNRPPRAVKSTDDAAPMTRRNTALKIFPALLLSTGVPTRVMNTCRNT